MTRPADPLAPIAAAAIKHMNSDHADALLADARGLAGRAWAETAQVEPIDAHGLTLHVTAPGRAERTPIPFEPPLTDPAQVRPTLLAMAQRARSALTRPACGTAPPPERDERSTERLFNLIATRRSFSLQAIAPTPIDLALVEQMLDAANWAPSHGTTDPWRFVVYSGDARRIVGAAFGAAFRLLTPAAPPASAGEHAQRASLAGAGMDRGGDVPRPQHARMGGADRRWLCSPEHAPDGGGARAGCQVDQQRRCAPRPCRCGRWLRASNAPARLFLRRAPGGALARRAAPPAGRAGGLGARGRGCLTRAARDAPRSTALARSGGP